MVVIIYGVYGTFNDSCRSLEAYCNYCYSDTLCHTLPLTILGWSLFVRYRSLDELAAIGCDETNFNTGRSFRTIILQLEMELQKNHYNMCQFQANELSLRHRLTF